MRRSFVALVVALSLPLAGCRREQEVPTVAILNLLSYPILDQSIEGIKTGLAEAGYGEGQIRILEANANGETDKLPALVQEMLAARPDVIVPVSTPVAQEVFRLAPPSQQIVFSTVTSPEKIWGDSVRTVPANITGVSDVVNYDANIDLIFKLYPNAKTIGMPYNPGEANSVVGVDRVRQLASERGFTLRLVPVTSSDQVADAARAMVGVVDVVYVGSDNTVASGIAGLLSVAQEHRLPVVASDAGSVFEGAPVAVSVDYRALGRRAGHLIAEVLKSRRPAGTFPPVRIVGNQFVANPQAIQRLGMTVPDSLLARAGR